MATVRIFEVIFKKNASRREGRGRGFIFQITCRWALTIEVALLMCPYLEPIRSLLHFAHTKVRAYEMSFTSKFELFCNEDQILLIISSSVKITILRWIWFWIVIAEGLAMAIALDSVPYKLFGLIYCCVVCFSLHYEDMVIIILVIIIK